MDLDRLFQRAFGDAEPEHWGTGWISGTLSVFLGALGLAAVACLIWPQMLTSPDVRAMLPLPWVRASIEVLIGLAFLCGLTCSLLRRRKVLGFTGMGLAPAAGALGGGHVGVPSDSGCCDPKGYSEPAGQPTACISSSVIDWCRARHY
jgi:lathosterol oxidase